MKAAGIHIFYGSVVIGKAFFNAYLDFLRGMYSDLFRREDTLQGDPDGELSQVLLVPERVCQIAALHREDH